MTESRPARCRAAWKHRQALRLMITARATSRRRLLHVPTRWLRALAMIMTSASNHRPDPRCGYAEPHRARVRSPAGLAPPSAPNGGVHTDPAVEGYRRTLRAIPGSEPSEQGACRAVAVSWWW